MLKKLLAIFGLLVAIPLALQVNDEGLSLIFLMLSALFSPVAPFIFEALFPSLLNKLIFIFLNGLVYFCLVFALEKIFKKRTVFRIVLGIILILIFLAINFYCLSGMSKVLHNNPAWSWRVIPV